MEKYQQVLSRKDFVAWKRSKSEMEKLQKLVTEELNRDTGTSDVPSEKAKSADERLLLVTRR